jgi:hypothetical protein
MRKIIFTEGGVPPSVMAVARARQLERREM